MEYRNQADPKAKPFAGGGESEIEPCLSVSHIRDDEPDDYRIIIFSSLWGCRALV